MLIDKPKRFSLPVFTFKPGDMIKFNYNNWGDESKLEVSSCEEDGWLIIDKVHHSIQDYIDLHFKNQKTNYSFGVPYSNIIEFKREK